MILRAKKLALGAGFCAAGAGLMAGAVEAVSGMGMLPDHNQNQLVKQCMQRQLGAVATTTHELKGACNDLADDFASTTITTTSLVRDSDGSTHTKETTVVTYQLPTALEFESAHSIPQGEVDAEKAKWSVLFTAMGAVAGGGLYAGGTVVMRKNELALAERAAQTQPAAE